MPRDGTKTREAILDAAMELALDRGLSAASLDQVIERAGITKGAFFYHFKNKPTLTLALVERFARQDHELFQDLVKRAEGLSRDPLQQVLLLVGLTAEMFQGATKNPGCLIASYCYQGDLWSEDARTVSEQQFREWSDWVEGKLIKAAESTPPAVNVDLRQVAEMFQSIVEGAFVLSRTYNDPAIVRKQILAWRDMLEALFRSAN